MDMDLKNKNTNRSIKNSMPNALGQNAPMDKGKISQCNNADCTNAQVQNALMQRIICTNHYQRIQQIILQIIQHIFPSILPSKKRINYFQRI